MKKILLTILILLLLVVGYILLNTFTFKSKQIKVEPVTRIDIPVTAKKHMALAIQIPTVSNEHPEEFDSAAFYRFRTFVKDTYPLTDSLLDVTYINDFSMIFKWQGSENSLKPIILMGHLDVVPVAEENKVSWSAAPFGGEIKDGFIWGRGAIDDKISVIGNLEAIELLLKEGFNPKRTIYLCIGHDEEVGGLQGAVAIVEHLQALNVEAEFVIDEGFAILQGLVPGITEDIALIGTAEKGFITLELSVNMAGGHSSMPTKETAIDVLARAIVKLKENPFPGELSLPVQEFMTYAGPEMSFMPKLVFANSGIFKPLILSSYQETPSGNALVRTTTSPTIINAGIKDNIIPYQASASVNFRIIPGTSIAGVRERVIGIINDDRIKIKEGAFSSEAPKASSSQSFGYEMINTSIKQIFPKFITAPNLVVGATDSRHYYPLSKDVYRFTPFYLNNENITSFHGINERIPVDDFENAVRFYVRLIKNSTSG